MNQLYANDIHFCNSRNISHLAGIDEAGRGCLAGPVVIASVILDNSYPIDNLNDSKKLSSKLRESLYETIVRSCIGYSIVEIAADVIDQINIRQASISGFSKVFLSLASHFDFALIDGKDVPDDISMKASNIIKGDSIHAYIAAASILAKVHRDRLMISLDQIYPQYGFAIHKGYGTKAHYSALKSNGPCPEHRQSFRLC